MSKPEILIDINNLKVRYADITALSIPQLRLRGNTFAVIGHNGSGKSTLIKTILELLLPDSGSLNIHLANTDFSKRLIPSADMAYSPESGAVFGDVSVEEYLQLWSSLKHGSRKAYKKKFSDLLEALEINSLRKKLGRELSKGQKRRVQTLVGFICQPKLFLLDEPFDGLDIIQTNFLIELIEEKSADISFIISSHRMEVVEKLADKVIILDQGQIAYAGKVNEVIQEISGKNCSLIDAMNIYLNHR